jgi:hypothetical protein
VLRRILLGLALTLAGATLMAPAGVVAQDEEEVAEPGLRDLMPSWAPGTEWEVEYSPLVAFVPKDGTTERLTRDAKKKLRARFVVKGKKDLGGVACHVVVITAPDRPNEETTLLVRAQDLSLKEIRRKTPSSETVTTNERTPFVQLELSPICPLDLPLFPRESKDEERTFDLGEGRKVTQKITVGKETTKIELKTQWLGKPLVSTITWKKGDPFWTSCVRTLDGKEDDRGELDPKSVKAPKDKK